MLTQQIQAIETRYKGYRFRSRLEARWAVFLDALNVAYEYEPQGFDLAGERYLPDFWLPAQGCWIEVKGQEPTPRELDLTHRLAQARQQPVYLLVGSIPLPDTTDWNTNDSAYLSFPEGGEDVGHWWCECESCGRIGLEFGGCAGRLHQHVEGKACRWWDEQTKYEDYAPGGYATPRLIRAYEAARSARFEHGEAPGYRTA